MKNKANIQKEVELDQPVIPSSAAREYITEMLAELCAVAKRAGQEDLHMLLKLTYQVSQQVSEQVSQHVSEY